MVIELVGLTAALAAAYAVAKNQHWIGEKPTLALPVGSKPEAGGPVSNPGAQKRLVAAYAPGNEEPPAAPAEWAPYGGARPELRGAPANTILAVKGLASRSPEFRAMLLDLAEKTGIPVDSIAAVMSSESNGLDPAAENPLPAAGLLQLTVGANLEGFRNKDAIRSILKMSAEEQLEKVWEPYLLRFKASRPWTPGQFYMRNFLPDKAASPPDTVIGIKGQVHEAGPKAGKPTFSGLVYQWNSGFDAAKKGTITIQDVYDVASKKARNAKGRRLTVDGTVIEARATKGIAAAAKNAVEAVAINQKKRNEDGSYPLLMPVAGLLREAVNDGRLVVPAWVPVRIEASGFVLDIEVTADALQMPIDLRITAADIAQMPAVGSGGPEDVVPREPQVISRPLRIPASYADVVVIAKKLDAVTPTKWLWDRIWAQSTVKLEPTPIPAGPKMATLLYSHAFDVGVGMATMAAEMSLSNDARRLARPWLMRDVGKGWILSPRLTKTGAVNYGWLVPAADRKTATKALQSPGAKHDATHVDYSQTVTLIKRSARVNGTTVDLVEWLAGPQYAAASGEKIEARFCEAFR